MKSENFKYLEFNITLIIGFMAFSVFIYRFIYLFLPMISKALYNKDIKKFSQSLTLLI